MTGGDPAFDEAIDRWTERFAAIDDPPAVFDEALRDGWDPARRAALAAEAAEYAAAQRAWREQIAEAGVDLVRFDCRNGSCGVCARYCGRAYSLRGETPGLPEPPPLPICPACRHTLNLLTPFYMQSLGLTIEDLIADSEPYAD